MQHADQTIDAATTVTPIHFALVERALPVENRRILMTHAESGNPKISDSNTR
jgi:hypothetical protein